MGRHARRSSDPEPYEAPAFGQAGTPREVAAFTQNMATHIVDAADKRLHGQAPYDNEPGSKPAIDPETGNRRNQ